MAAKKWIKSAVSNAHGQFKAKAEKAGKSTAEFAREKDSAPGKTGKQARLAETLMGLNHSRKAGDHETGSKAGGKPPRKSSTERANLRYGKKE